MSSINIKRQFLFLFWYFSPQNINFESYASQPDFSFSADLHCLIEIQNAINCKENNISISICEIYTFLALCILLLFLKSCCLSEILQAKYYCTIYLYVSHNSHARCICGHHVIKKENRRLPRKIFCPDVTMTCVSVLCEQNGDDSTCNRPPYTKDTCGTSLDTTFHCPWMCNVCPCEFLSEQHVSDGDFHITKRLMRKRQLSLCFPYLFVQPTYFEMLILIL